MDLGLEGRTAIVTGGTRGIGKSIVEGLLREGCRVATCARREAPLDNWCSGEFAADRLAVRALDVSDHGALAGWVEDVAARFGSLDIVVANASALAEGKTPQAWRDSLELDVLATAELARAARPFLEQAVQRDGDASVITVASVSASLTLNVEAYGAIKAALIHYTKGLSKDWAAQGIRVNSVSPGTIYFEGGVWERTEKEDPGFFAAASAMNPLGRMGAPDEVANGVTFLASPRASFVTGANLVIDGGLTSQLMI